MRLLWLAVLDWALALTSKRDFVANSQVRTLQGYDTTSLGLDTVKQEAGWYETAPGHELFYWFFESRNDPKHDPVLLWLNGGPGCSSLDGLFYEHGPSRIDTSLQPVYNEFSWNSNASIIYLDQPVGTGFSFDIVLNDTVPGDTVTAMQDVYRFLDQFFGDRPNLQRLDFHVVGESYAGHYIPALGKEILLHKDRQFNFRSLMIGNGLTDALTQYKYYYPMACGINSGYSSVLTRPQCDELRDATPDCIDKIQDCYDDPTNATVCSDAIIFCDEVTLSSYPRDVYDIRRTCPDGGNDCVPGDYTEQYLNQAFVKKALGLSTNFTYELCSNNVLNAFYAQGDHAKPYFVQDVRDVLESGIPVLVYAGDKDYICNWLGNQAWTKALKWSGGAGFRRAKPRCWDNSLGEPAGEATHCDLLTFLRVYDAGHMVPHDQPRNSLEFVNNWLLGNYAIA